MENWQDALEDFRDELTKVLRPDRYFDKLRANGILDESDTEEIGNDVINPTRSKKAGCFLDIVRKRGLPAYQLVLECLEADHGDLFKKMTGREPKPKEWTLQLKPLCSCSCHDSSRSDIDFVEALKQEKQATISLRSQNNQLKSSLDKIKEDRMKIRHDFDILRREFDVCQSDRQEIDKLKMDNQWKREQICNLQAQAFELQRDLMYAKEALRESKLENNTLENKLREARARENLQRKKSIRLEQEQAESTEKMKPADTLKKLVEQLQQELFKDRLAGTLKQSSFVSEPEREMQEDTARDIMREDRDAALRKCEEAVTELYEVRQANYELRKIKEKLETSNEDLEDHVIHLNEQIDMITDRLQMAQDQLEQVSSERTQAMQERNRSFSEIAQSLVERDDLVKKLNTERASYLKISRQLFVAKTKIQHLRREKQTFYSDRPSSQLSTDGSTSNDSKRSSTANDPQSPEVSSEALPLSYSQQSSVSSSHSKPTSSHNGPHSSRSKSTPSLGNSTVHSSFDEDEESAEVEDDYEHPTGFGNDADLQQRYRTAVLTKEPASVTRRKSKGTQEDVGRLPALNGKNQEPVPRETDETENSLPELPTAEGHWEGFDYNADDSPLPYLNRSRRSLPQSDSMEVQQGSLKDKNRHPSPRISTSFDVPPVPNYMAQLNRRSKTLPEYSAGP
ncbi:uncharacterized protein [Diadema antillarum]|uniref:uncharacterized protein n=1 Tax=Diadema antillarum TaxID=105358 RepID=UPI003A868CF1